MKLILATVFLSALLALAACSPPEQEAVESPKVEGPLTSVHMTAAQLQHGGVAWARAESQEMAPSIEIPGELLPNDDRTVRLGAPAEGRVLRVTVAVGDQVARGKALVELQSPSASAALADLVKARAEINSRRAALAYAKTARERAERLLAAKAGARQDLDRALADEELAQAALAQAEAETARARVAIEQLGVSPSTGQMAIRSPLSGLVLAREVTAGAVVQAGAPLVTVSDVSTLWLKIAAPDRAANALVTGQSVRFSVPALPGETFQARVDSLGGGLDPQTRTIPVRATVANANGRLRPHMFATVLLEVGAKTNTIAVPEEAVVLLDERPAVFISTPEDGGGARLERRNVQVGGKAGERTLVIGGIQPNDNVVVRGAFAVKSLFERAKMPS